MNDSLAFENPARFRLLGDCRGMFLASASDICIAVTSFDLGAPGWQTVFEYGDESVEAFASSRGFRGRWQHLSSESDPE